MPTIKHLESKMADVRKKNPKNISLRSFEFSCSVWSQNTKSINFLKNKTWSKKHMWLKTSQVAVRLFSERYIALLVTNIR